jgi:Flp pilus assembly pilin Flp
VNSTHLARKRKGAVVTEPSPRIEASFRRLFARIHRDEKGEVSIETILILAAIALPILIFIIKFGWPRVKKFFEKGMEDLEGGAAGAAADGS